MNENEIIEWLYSPNKDKICIGFGSAIILTYLGLKTIFKGVINCLKSF